MDGYQPDQAWTADGLLWNVSNFGAEIVLTECGDPKVVRRLLNGARKTSPWVQIILLTERTDQDLAVESMQAGALDILQRPPAPAAIRRSVGHAYRLSMLRRDNHELSRENNERRKHYHSLLNHAAVIIVETDADLRITFMNQYAESLLGYSSNKVRGRTLFDVFYPNAAETRGVREIYESTVLADVFQGAHVFRTEISDTRGKPATVRWTASTVNREQGGARIINIGTLVPDEAKLEKRNRALLNEINGNNHKLKRKIRENERLQTIIRRYTARSVWDRANLSAADGLVEIPTESSEFTLMFTDIQGFTSFSEDARPELVLETLNELLEIIADAIISSGGDIDKFIGDAVFAVFESPRAACIAGAEIQANLDEWNQARADAGLRELPVRIGIHTGHAIRGNVGGCDRKDNTLIGDSVNIASRLEAMCEPGRVLISETTVARIGMKMSLEPRRLTVRGRTEPMNVYYLDEAEVSR